MEQYAYIRVSTKEQHIDRQIMAFHQKIFTAIISPEKTLNVRNIVS